MLKNPGGGRRLTRRPVAAACLAVLMGAACGAGAAAPPHFLVSNDDIARPTPPSTVSFYDIDGSGGLGGPAPVSTGGNGIAGGYLGIARVVVADGDGQACVFASNAQSENIAAIDGRERKLTGLFNGTAADVRIARDGIGLALGLHYLYASYSGSGNIAAFRVQPGCKLEFAGEIHAQGLSGGLAEGMAVRGTLLVVAYGDGSVGSFDVSAGVPVAHDDAQYVSGTRQDFNPGAVDISRDGHYAIFGGGTTATEVQVSDISSGKITPPKVYRPGAAWGAGSVRLSPDERLLYISNSAGGRVTAAFFDHATGRVRAGCTSAPLKGFYKSFTYLGAVATELPTGSGGAVYVPEFDKSGGSGIGLLRLALTGRGCSLTELADSPAAVTAGSALLSIGVYPPRPF